MLAVLLTIVMFSQGLSMDNQGTNFITAFPENIAYYFQNNLNYLKITILYPNTYVSIFYGGNGINNTRNFSAAGITWTLNFTKDVEEYRLTLSNKSIIISSNNNITVLSMTGWPGRLQSHVVQPVQNLRTVYTIPTLNYTKIMGTFRLPVSSEVRYNSFRLLIINAVNVANTVSIKQVVTGGQIQVSTQTLNPYFLYQQQSNGEVIELSGTDKIAVILTHPCFESNCSCNMVMNQLRPTMPNVTLDSFPIPVSFTEIKQLFLTTNQSVRVAVGALQPGSGIPVTTSTDILPSLYNVNYGTQLITTSMPVSLRLITLGIILDLIPLSMFSGCFLVHFYSSNTSAFVIAETSSRSFVQMNAEPLSAATWTEISGTQYSMAAVRIGNTQPTSATIWHPNSKITVYMKENWQSGNNYASPAIIINNEPDPKGCALTTGKFVVGNEDLNWTMSREYCKNNFDNLANIFLQNNQNMMAANIIVPEPTEGWISLRRSLFTTEWYWSNKDNTTTPLNFTYWGDQQPDLPERGLCASVYMDLEKTFKWKSARCCSIKKPICYKSPPYLILNPTPVY